MGRREGQGGLVFEDVEFDGVGAVFRAVVVDGDLFARLNVSQGAEFLDLTSGVVVAGVGGVGVVVERAVAKGKGDGALAVFKDILRQKTAVFAFKDFFGRYDQQWDSFKDRPEGDQLLCKDATAFAFDSFDFNQRGGGKFHGFSVFSFQFSVVSCQLSVFGFQFSVFGFRWAVWGFQWAGGGGRGGVGVKWVLGADGR